MNIMQSAVTKACTDELVRRMEEALVILRNIVTTNAEEGIHDNDIERAIRMLDTGEGEES